MAGDLELCLQINARKQTDAMSTVETLPMETVRERLQKHDARNDPRIRHLVSTLPSRYQRASVFIGLIYKGDVLNVLLTLRSSSLRHHANTVSFPGGKSDEADANEMETALREAEEEIGLDKSHVQVVCTLPPMIASPNYFTTAVVGFVSDDFSPNINTDEVAEIFVLPLNRFLQDERHTTSFVDRSTADFFLRYVIHSFNDDVKGQTMVTWGFTANFCCNLATVVFNQAGFNLWDGLPISLEDPFKQNIEILQKLFNVKEAAHNAKM